MSSLPIESGRLRLRRFTVEDAAHVAEFVSHPSVAQATPEIKAGERGALDYINMQNSYRPFETGKCFDLAIQRKEDGQVMGLLSIVRDASEQADIGYALGINYRGQGYATEAAVTFIEYGFTRLGLKRICASTRLSNLASWGVMQRAGMSRVEQKSDDRSDQPGADHDQVVYAVTAGQWRESRVND